MQRKTKIIVSLVLALCFVLVTPSLVHADNIYFQEDFTTPNVCSISSGGSQIVELKEDATRTYLHIRNDMPNTLAQFIKSVDDIPIDQEKLFVSIDVRINEGERSGVLYLHLVKDDGNSFNIYLYFLKATENNPHGKIDTMTGSTTLGLNIYMTPQIWITHRIDVSHYLKTINTNNWDYDTLNLSKLRTVLFWGWCTNAGLIDISFDSFIFSKSEYGDIVNIPDVPDTELITEFEFTTMHFVIFTIAGILVFILINKNRRKKVRGFIKKYLKV